MDIAERDINAVCFGILCNFPQFCGEERAKEAAELVHALYAERETLRADLARVTAERDGAVADIAAILAEVEEIRRGYGVDNADADNAFADLCGNYCAKCGNNCYGEAEDYRCKNYEWRGIKEDNT